jgi:predicted dehydrogenase
MRFAIAGCGLIGQKRLKTLSGRHSLVVATDPVPGRAERLASQVSGARAEADWHRAVAAPDVDVVIVATTNDALAPVTIAALQAGKHVIVEKPAARSLAELEPVIAKARESGKTVQVGFNHRFHPAFRKACEIFDTGALGEMMFIRARYGHGGRVGYDREWRANPQLSGGGELLDQGVHLIDLSRWFLGDFASVDGFAHTYYWDMPVDDNGFLILRTAGSQCAFLHASCSEWKNLFSFEIYGRKAKLHIEGLGGSYGVERLYYYAMKPEMGPPDTTIWEYPGDDRSWQHELDMFVNSIEGTGPPGPGLEDAAAALRIVEQVYRTSGYPVLTSASEKI